MVAQYADACNIFEMPIPMLKAKLDVLQQHCADLGRDYGDIEKTILGRADITKDGADGSQTVEQAVDRFGALAEIGIDHAIVGLSNPADPASFEQIGELTAALDKITPAGR